MAESKSPSEVFQLKITLNNIRPPVWRRVQVGDCSLETLHEIIQIAMRWDNYHLHDFEIGRQHYGPPDPSGMMEVLNEKSKKLSQLAVQFKKFTYTYDFGDNWDHTILIEKKLAAERGVQYPRCITAKRACPPEDCGGPWGYEDFLDAISNPQHPEHEEMLEWIGGAFDPEHVDIDAINAKLKNVR